MTVWSTPMPMYMANEVPHGPERGLVRGEPRRAGSGEGGASQGGQHGRRHSLGTVPTAAQVQESQDKWLEYAPTSPTRRASFVSEPSAIQGNPFEIYKETSDSLAPNSFYEAGASYAVKDSADQNGNLGSSMRFPFNNNANSSISVSSSASNGNSACPAPLSASRSSKPAVPTGNPFYDAPLSPIRYNKPIPKVELSPGSHAIAKMAFLDLDPLKKVESPYAQIPLDQLKKQASLPVQGSSAAAAADPFGANGGGGGGGGGFQQQHSFSHWPQGTSFTAAAPSSASSSFGSYGMPSQQQGQQPQCHHQGSTGWDASFPPPQQQQALQFPPSSSFASQPQLQQQGGSGFDSFTSAPLSSAVVPFDVGNWAVAPSNLANKPASPLNLSFQPEPIKGTFQSGSSAGSQPDPFASSELDGSFFDPVRQKSLADQSFDLGVGSYFPESNSPHRRGQSQQGGYDDDDEEGPIDDAHDEDDDDGSINDGPGFELQEDQFSEGSQGIDQALCYTVSFNAPTQFGMLLERKDEWTRGVVTRRERTVVTLVVEGGEAEAKGVALGSMIVSINGENVVDKTYKQTLELIKSPQRPMKVVFERESLKEEVLQGYFFVSKGPFFSTPTKMDKWKRKYIVLGGPIAKKNVLQVYDSKRAYHNTVVALFQRKRPTHRVKTYAMTYSFKCSDLQERKMDGHTAPLKYFTFMTPTARFKSIRLASETKKSVQLVHERVRRFTGKR